MSGEDDGVSKITVGYHPDYRDGKAVIFVDGEPTRIWAGSIKRSFLAYGDREEFRKEFPDISDDMIQAAIQHTWPRHFAPEWNAMDDMSVRCACGELSLIPGRERSFACETCGRVWRIDVSLTEVTA